MTRVVETDAGSVNVDAESGGDGDENDDFGVFPDVERG
jgi:hypothetical protein